MVITKLDATIHRLKISAVSEGAPDSGTVSQADLAAMVPTGPLKTALTKPAAGASEWSEILTGTEVSVIFTPRIVGVSQISVGAVQFTQGTPNTLDVALTLNNDVAIIELVFNHSLVR